MRGGRDRQRDRERGEEEGGGASERQGGGGGGEEEGEWSDRVSGRPGVSKGGEYMAGKCQKGVMNSGGIIYIPIHFPHFLCICI